LKQANAGDRAAGSALVERYYPPLWKYFARRVGADERTDLIQETFTRLLRSHDRLLRTSTFRTYLFRIADVVFREHVRRRQPHASPNRDGVADSSESAESVLWLNDALHRISPHAREVLELRYIHEMSAKEIAEVLGLSESTVRRLVVRARNELAKELGDHEPFWK
jgi:RNA polymerase sigma-70 factor (ECF subfamily)